MRDHLLGYPPALDYMGLPPDRPRASYTPPRQRVEPSEQVLRNMLDCDPSQTAALKMTPIITAVPRPWLSLLQPWLVRVEADGRFSIDWREHDQTMQWILQAAGAR